MLPSQRALFDIPRDVCFLNAAAWSPLPIAVQEAGRAAVGRKGQPWKLDGAFFQAQYERARKAAAALIGKLPDLHLYTISVEEVRPMCTELSPAVAANVPELARLVRTHAGLLATSRTPVPESVSVA